MTKDEVDMVFLEADYRAGILPVKALAENYSTSTSNIARWAKQYGWERDLKAVVRERAQKLVEQQLADNSAFERSEAVSETQSVEVYAQMQKGVMLRSQARISNLQKTTDRLIAELSAQMMTAEEVSAVAELVALGQGQLDENESVSPAQVAKRVDAFRKLVSLNERVETMTKLAGVVKTLTALEYSVFGIKDNMNGDANDTQGGDVVQSINDAARRVAFVLASAARNQQRPPVTLENEPQ